MSDAWAIAGGRCASAKGCSKVAVPIVLRALEDQVARFRSWAEAYPSAERFGEWECDYDDWWSVYDAFLPFVATTTCQEWSSATTQMLLYIIARDNEFGQLAHEVAKNPNNLLCLAKRVVDSPEPDARWQIAVELGQMAGPSAQVEEILTQFAHDDDEYVRRRALIALADIGSPHVADFVEPAWDTGHEYQRMAVLHALRAIGSPQLEEYLARADADGRQHLVDYAMRIRAGATAARATS